MGDRYQMADRPILSSRIETAIDDAAGSVQRHQTSDEALGSRSPSFGDGGAVTDRRIQGLARNLETPLESQRITALQFGLQYAGVLVA